MALGSRIGVNNRLHRAGKRSSELIEPVSAVAGVLVCAALIHKEKRSPQRTVGWYSTIAARARCQPLRPTQ
jgi:hypothetical protein